MTRLQSLSSPGEAGEVSPSYGDGGVMGCTDAAAHDPSVADYRATSPRFAQGET